MTPRKNSKINKIIKACMLGLLTLALTSCGLPEEESSSELAASSLVPCGSNARKVSATRGVTTSGNQCYYPAQSNTSQALVPCGANARKVSATRGVTTSGNACYFPAASSGDTSAMICNSRQLYQPPSHTCNSGASYYCPSGKKLVKLSTGKNVCRSK